MRGETEDIESDLDYAKEKIIFYLGKKFWA